jgi:hypothetical protein
MCEVHLVPEVEEVRVAETHFTCGECDEPVPAGKKYMHIEGPLDDGSSQRWLYRAHEECWSLSVSDVGEDGCFQYGRAEPIKDKGRENGRSLET